MGSLRVMQYRTVAALVLLVLALVNIVDAFSSWLPRRFS